MIMGDVDVIVSAAESCVVYIHACTFRHVATVVQKI